MAGETNFVVRISGRRENSYYIDYLGSYKVAEIAKVAGIKPVEVKEIYLSNGAEYDEDMCVYYFNSVEAANKAASDITKKTKSEYRGRLVFLTEAEIEYIRKALISEGGNTIRVKNKIKDAIFKKLNA